MSANHSLLEIMEKCGHFLYHRRGGKRGQGRILRVLLNEGEMTQKELQEHIRIQPGSMSEIVMKLENAGFIVRTKDESDRRKVILKITEEGKQIVSENMIRNAEQEQTLFKALDEEEQKTLQELLSKLFQDWETTYDKSLFEHRKGNHHRAFEENEGTTKS